MVTGPFVLISASRSTLPLRVGRVGSLFHSKLKNNPMHSRTAIARPARDRSDHADAASSLSAVTRNLPALARRRHDARHVAALSAIEGRHTSFLILRILFDPSGKTMALCHAVPFGNRSQLSAVRRLSSKCLSPQLACLTSGVQSSTVTATLVSTGLEIINEWSGGCSTCLHVVFQRAGGCRN